MLSACMPQCEHLKSAIRDLVVDEVADTSEEETSDARSSGSFIFGADTGLLGQQGHGFSEVRTDRSRSGRTVLCPPLGCFLDLACCSGGDLDPERHAQSCFGNDCSNSSRVTYSPRSISAIAASSSSS